MLTYATRPHVATLWAARNIKGSSALLSGERNRVQPGSSLQRAARPIPSGFLRFYLSPISRACCRASSASLTKLAFLRNAFVQFAGMSDVIFKFATSLR